MHIVVQGVVVAVVRKLFVRRDDGRTGALVVYRFTLHIQHIDYSFFLNLYICYTW